MKKGSPESQKSDLNKTTPAFVSGKKNLKISDSLLQESFIF